MNQGTESLLDLAADLRESAPKVRSAFRLGYSAALMERAADAIERLAELDPDIDSELGEN